MKHIVYLHGFGSGPGSNKARFFTERLGRDGVRFDVPDLAGGDFERLSVTGQLAIVEQVAGGGPVSLMGSSLGGYVAALYAARHAEVERVVLLAPAFGFARRWVERLGGPAVAQWRRSGTLDVYHYGEGRNRKLGYQLLADAERYEEFPEFEQPALIFHGVHDDVVPVGVAREFAAGRENVRLEVMESGHELLNVLEEIAGTVEEFLAV